MIKLQATCLLMIGMLMGLVSHGQQQESIYTKPLKEVLSEVGKMYNVNFVYDEKLAEGRNVQYATWRYTSDIVSTLNSILLPLDLVYGQKDNKTYTISPFVYYQRTEEEGKKHLDRLLKAYPNAASFNERKSQLRECIAQALQINLNAEKTPLNPVMRGKKIMDGYSVENVAFESIPGYFVTGTLYRPLKGKGPFPVVLNPHGHFYNEQDPSIAKDSSRYRPDMQIRCAALAKMGAIAFNYDMYSWGESVLMTGDPKYHHTGFALSIQTWNTLRTMDFLLSLPGADKKRVAVTGASGGGTQTFLAAALDDRIAVSVPVVMVSSSFYGGCECESGLPIHGVCNGNNTNNAEIAATFAPKPMLVVADGSDWTKSVPGTDYPYLKKIYAFYNSEANVESVYLPDDQHDYGIHKRRPVYKFLAEKLGLNIKAITGKNGEIDESSITIQNHDDLLVFRNNPLPASALRSHVEIMKSFYQVHNLGNK
ncbi:MAG TPA: acetylxylan esterase [Flavitalea sp.]|nr:acetylxylan esterase [Flavitalea sp.]